MDSRLAGARAAHARQPRLEAWPCPAATPGQDQLQRADDTGDARRRRIAECDEVRYHKTPRCCGAETLLSTMMRGRVCTQLPPKSVRVHARNAARADGPSCGPYLPSVRSVCMLEQIARHDGSEEPSAFTGLATKDHQAVTTRKRRHTPQATPPDATPTPGGDHSAVPAPPWPHAGGPGGPHRSQLNLHQ